MLECNFSDYELYQILEASGYKTTNENKDILKRGIQEGRYYIEDELDSLLLEEFKEYLNSEPIILGEEILTEGKILDKLRWKLALFSLRFLSNTSINAFFIAYYADKEGNPTEKGKEFCRRPRKEKLAKMRELANGVKDDVKAKVINSPAARAAEKGGAGAFVGAAISGVGAGLLGHGNHKLDSIKNDIDVKADMPKPGSGNTTSFDDGSNINSWDDVKENIVGEDIIKDSGSWDNSGSSSPNTVNGVSNAIIGKLSTLATFFFGVMWGAIILAGVEIVRGVLKLHKANTLRRDEIMAELKGKMSPEKARELAKQYKAEFKAEKKANIKLKK